MVQNKCLCHNYISGLSCAIALILSSVLFARVCVTGSHGACLDVPGFLKLSEVVLTVVALFGCISSFMIFNYFLKEFLLFNGLIVMFLIINFMQQVRFTIIKYFSFSLKIALMPVRVKWQSPKA